MAIQLVDNTAGAGEPLKDGFDKVNQAILLLNSIGNPDDFVRIFASLNADGVTTEALDGFYSEIPVRLYSSIRTGIDFKVINKETGDSFLATSAENAVEGDVTLSIAEEQYIQAPAGSYIKWDEVQRSAELTVSPSLVQLGVEAERSANSIGTIATRIAPGIPLSTIDLKDVLEDIDVKDGDSILIENKRGFSEFFVVSGDQTVTQGTYSLAINSKVFSASYEADYAWVFEAGWQQSSRITVLSDEIVLKVDSNGKIATVALRADADTGSTISIAADQINIDGTTTFGTGYDPTDKTAKTDSRKFIVDNGLVFTDGTGDFTIDWAQFNLLLGSGDTITVDSGSQTGSATVTDSFYVDLDEAIGGGNYTLVNSSAGMTTPLKLAEVYYGDDAADGETFSYTQVRGVISGSNLAFKTITASQIAASTITATEISVSSLSAISADLGSVTAGSIVVGSTDKLWLNDAGDGGLAIGGSTKASAPFRVSASGDVVAESVTTLKATEIFSATEVVKITGSRIDFFDPSDTATKTGEFLATGVGVRVQGTGSLSLFGVQSGGNLTATDTNGIGTDGRFQVADGTFSTSTTELYVNTDLRINPTTAASSAVTAGGDSAVPSAVEGYWVVNINGTDRAIPYFPLA